MAKFRKMDDLYGRFLDHIELDDVPIAAIDKDGNTVVMTKAEYEEMLREEQEEEKEQEEREGEQGTP